MAADICPGQPSRPRVTLCGLQQGLTISGTQKLPFGASPPTSADCCHTAAISPEKDHWAHLALDYSLSLASHWRHTPTFLLICTCPCPHPHALHRTFLAGHTHQSNRPYRVYSFTYLSLWPKTLMKVEQILFAEMDQPIY